MTSLGEFLRTRREAAGLSLRETARRAHISPTFLCRLEKLRPKERLGMSDATATRLANAVNCDPEHVLRYLGRMPEDVKKTILDDDGAWVFAIRAANKRGISGLDLLALIQKKRP